MNPDVKSLIEFALWIAGCDVALWKFFDFLKARIEVKEREKSVGAAKVAELVLADKKMTEEFEKLKNKQDVQDEDIDQLESDYKEMYKMILDLYKLK